MEVSADHGMIASESLLGYHTSEHFTAFIRDKMMPELDYARTLIMDNASWHHSEVRKDILEQAGHRIIFQPPDTPQFTHLFVNQAMDITAEAMEPWYAARLDCASMQFA